MSALASPQRTHQIRLSSIRARELIALKFYHQRVNSFLDERGGLRRFYEGDRLEDAASHAKDMGDQLMGSGCTPEFALCLSLLSLYDIVVLIGAHSLRGGGVCGAPQWLTCERR